jgi:hypothetical protein
MRDALVVGEGFTGSVSAEMIEKLPPLRPAFEDCIGNDVQYVVLGPRMKFAIILGDTRRERRDELCVNV